MPGELQPLLVTEEEAQRLRAFLLNQEGVTIVGYGGMAVRRDGKRISITGGRAGSPSNIAAGNRVISGKITGNAAGNGKYTGKSFKSMTADVAASGSLAESELGGLQTANDCLVLNLAELGSSTTGHDVTAVTNTAQFAIYFVGLHRWTNSDGTKVIEAVEFFVGCA